MYWTAFNIAPNQQQLKEAAVTQDKIDNTTRQAAEQNAYIIETVNNNTDKLERIITSQQALTDNQVILVRELGNMSADLGAKSQSIDQNSKVLVLQSAGIQNILDWAAKNFSEADKFNRQWEQDDRKRSGNILGNLSDMSKTLQLLELMAERNDDQIKAVAAFNRTINVTQ